MQEQKLVRPVNLCQCGMLLAKHELVDNKLVCKRTKCSNYRRTKKWIKMSEQKTKRKSNGASTKQKGKAAKKSAGKAKSKGKNNFPACPICGTNEHVAKAGTVSPTNTSQRYVCRVEHKAQDIKMKYFWEKPVEKAAEKPAQ